MLEDKNVTLIYLNKKKRKLTVLADSSTERTFFEGAIAFGEATLIC